MKRIFTLIMLSIFLFSCAKKDVNFLVMGTNDMFPPFAYIDAAQGKTPVGFDIELAKIIAKNYGKELKIKTMSFEDLISAVENGTVDMAICSMTITEARAERVDFSETYYEARQVAVVRKDDLSSFAGIKTKEDLGANAKLAAQVGTTGAATARSIAKGNPVLELETWALALIELSSKNVDATIIDRESAKAFIAKYSNLIKLTIPFETESYGVAVAKSNTKLLESVNKTIKDLKASGKYIELIENYIDAYAITE